MLWLVFTNAGVSLESSSFPFQPNESLPSNIPMSHLNLSRATFFIVRTSGELKVPAGMHMYCAAAWKAANSAMPRSVHQYESAFVTDLSFDVSPSIIAKEAEKQLESLLGGQAKG